MHWGMRRYQPYGKGGYNPKNKNRPKKKEPRKKKDRSEEVTKSIIKEIGKVAVSALAIEAGKKFLTDLFIGGRREAHKKVADAAFDKAKDLTKRPEHIQTRMDYYDKLYKY